MKMDKKITKFDDSGIKGFEFHQYKSPILINNIDINKMEVSNKLPFSKKDFKYFIVYKDAQKTDLYACSVQDWVYLTGVLIKLNLCFFRKDDDIWEKVSNIMKKEIIIIIMIIIAIIIIITKIVNLYITKII